MSSHRNNALKSPPPAAAAASSTDRSARAAAREQMASASPPAQAAAAASASSSRKPAFMRQPGPASNASSASVNASPARAARGAGDAASASSSSSAAAAASSSSASFSSLSVVGGARPSTSAPCTHGSDPSAHLVLPHYAAQREFWTGVVLAKLTPLAKYYNSCVSKAHRPTSAADPNEAAAGADAAASSSSSAAAAAVQQDDADPDIQMGAASQQAALEDEEEEGETVSAGARSSSSSSRKSKSVGPLRLWSRHSVSDAMAAPVSSISACITLLRSLRHPSSIGVSFTGKSLAHTLGEVMHPADTQHFLRVIVPFLAHMVLRLPQLFPEDSTCLPLLVSGVEATVTLSAAQCACIIACQFFSLFAPKAEVHQRDSTWPSCNMDAFFSVMRSPMSGKHMLIFNYFARIENPAEGITPNRFVSFHRRVMPEALLQLVADDAQFSRSTVPLASVIYRSEGCIEDAEHALQADFANRYIGGGVLYTGCVQEEIRFCLSPECLVSMVLAERLDEAESLILLGPKMYSHYSGYGTSLVFGSDCVDEGLDFDEFHRVSNSIVAIDALDFEHNDGSEDDITPAAQWRSNLMSREILKAFVGFSTPQEFVLQWLSASLSGRSLIYFSFDNPLAQSIPSFVDELTREFNSSAAASSSAPSSSSSPPVKWGSGAAGSPPPPLPPPAAAAAAGSSASSAFSSSSCPHGPSGSSVTVGELWRALKVVAPRWARARESDIKTNHDGLFADLIKAIKQARAKTAK